MTATPRSAFTPIPRNELQLQQMNQLYAASRLPQWLLLLAAVLITPLVWGRASPLSLLSWLTLLGALALIRHALVRRYWQATASDRLRARWQLFFHLGNLLSGFCLTWVYVGLTPPDDLPTQAALYSIVAGVSLCVGNIYATRLSAMASFIFPAWVVPVLFFIGQNDTHSALWALMGSILLMFLLLSAALLHHSMRNALITNIRNEALVKNLSSAQQHTEELNLQLTREISQRRSAEQSLRDSHDELEIRVQQRTAELEQASHDLRASQAQLRLALEASQLGLWDWNLVSDRVYHSHLLALLGLPDDQVPYMLLDLKPLLHPADANMVRNTLVRHMKNETPAYCIEYRIRHAEGHWLWVEDSGRAVERDENGRVTRMIGTRRDITARKYQDEQAQLASTVFEASSEGIFILGPTLQVLAVNRAYSVITGLAVGDAVGRNMLDLSGADEQRQQFMQLQYMLNTQNRWQGEMTAVRRSGETFPIWLQITVIRDSSGQITHYVGFFADLTTHRQTEEQLQYLANYDPLTQLANRSLFDERLQDATARALQRDSQLALLHVNLDRFKHINVSLGHAVADGLLQEAAKRLGQQVQAQDSLARLSADEFVIIVEDIGSSHALGEQAEQILDALRQPMLIGEHELVVTASIGISLFPTTARDSLVLINQANQAMQHAKQLGGNNWQFYTHELRAYSLDHLQLENQLRKALEENQLVVHYQPKLHLASGRISGAEALVRWQHPQRGLIMPGDFIHIAEETGMIVQLGDIVLNIACHQASRWHHEGPESLEVAVNLSVHQLRQAGFAERVAHILRNCNLPARLLELELTESMLAEYSNTVTDNIAALQNLGVRLSVDDFGTGYSSLAYLKRFPISTLKIDRAFIAELDERNRDDAIIRAIIAMAHSLSLKVIAEGVEHQVQLNILKEQGCDEVQGYLISCPVNAITFTSLLAENDNTPTPTEC